MRKKKTSKLLVFSIIFLIVAVLVVAGYFFIKGGGLSQTVTPSTGCTYIGTKTIASTTNVPCTTSECIVSGTMTVNKAMSIQELWWGCYRTGYDVGGWKTRDECTTKCCSAPNPCLPCRQDIVKGITSYNASFNFCPSTDANFPYCNGINNKVGASESKPYWTDEVKLVKGQSVTFAPKNLDNSPVTEFSVSIKEYDCSCTPAVANLVKDGIYNSGDACSSEHYYCKPITTTALNCQSGYNLVSYTSGVCETGTYTAVNGKVCVAHLSGWDTCVTPSSSNSVSYNTYQLCNATQTIQQSTCGAFGNGLAVCPSGQKCYSDGQLKEGLGSCGCSATSCTIGETSGTVGSDVYKKCEIVGSCPNLVDKTCPSGLKFDGTICNCDTTKLADFPTDARCSGTKSIISALKTTIGGVNCNYWQSAISCPGEKTCVDATGYHDYCSCEKVNTCTSGTIQCNTNDVYHYKKCEMTSDTNSCYAYRGNYTVNAGDRCVNNKIEIRDDIGCQYNTAGYSCATDKDSRGILLEKCYSNVCSATQDNYSALNGGKDKCMGNTVYYVKEYVITKGHYYRYEIKTNADYSNNGICKTGFTCGLDGGVGRCISENEFILIDSEDAYGVGTKIANITVQLTDKNTVLNNVPVTVWLTEFNKVTSLVMVKKITNSEGKVSLDFNYSHPRIGDLVLNVVIGNSTLNHSGSKNITVAKTLKINLNCPITGTINRDITCSLAVVDVVTQQPVSGATFDISVSQGGTELSGVDSSSSSIVFSTSMSGGVEVVVKASKTSYLDDIRKTSVEVGDSVLNKKFLVDGEDYKVFSGIEGIGIGVHELSFVIDESGGVADINSIDATIRIPSGAEIPLTFIVGADGKTWTSSYNLAEEGKVYVIKGAIIPGDVTKESSLFEYTLTTVGKSTEDLAQQKGNLAWIIGGIIGAVVVLVVMVAIFTRKKKRR